MKNNDPKTGRRDRFRKRKLHAIRKNRRERQHHQRSQVLVLEHPDCRSSLELTFPEVMARKARTIGRSLDQGMRHDIETAHEVLHSDDDGLAFA